MYEQFNKLVFRSIIYICVYELSRKVQCYEFV